MNRTIQALSWWLGLACIATHELDAVARKEWRILPLLNRLEDDTAEPVFVVLHIPLFFLIFGLTDRRGPARSVFSAAWMIHACAHFLLSGHAEYHFGPPIETVTVYAAAALGVVYLAAGMFDGGQTEA